MQPSLAARRLTTALALTLLAHGPVGCASDGDTADHGVPQDARVDGSPDAGEDPFGDTPIQFDTHKVLLEAFVAASAGFTPDAYVYLAQLESTYPGQFVWVAEHHADELDNPSSTARILAYQVGGYPYGAVNGNTTLVARDNWSEVIQAALARDSRCGLAIDARTPRVAEIRVACESGTPGEARLNVWAVEAAVTGPPQSNAFNTAMAHAYFDAGDPIPDFVHENVLRAFLTTGTAGEVVDLSAGAVSRVVDGSAACTDADCIVLAFVTVFDPTSGEQRVEAAEQVRYGSLLPW